MDIAEVFSQAALLAILFSTILLLPSVITGLLVSILQAATQVQDYTLSFVPKMFIVGLTLYLCGPWMFEQYSHFAQNMYSSFQIIERQ